MEFEHIGKELSTYLIQFNGRFYRLRYTLDHSIVVYDSVLGPDRGVVLEIDEEHLKHIAAPTDIEVYIKGILAHELLLKPKKPTLVVLLGDTCVGKTYLEKKLIRDYPITPIKIFTDREKRKDDPDHYVFIKTEEYEENAAKHGLDFFFHTEINDRWYGYLLPETNINGTYIVSFIQPSNAVHMANLARKQGFNVKFFHINASEEQISKCLQERNTPKAEAENRARLSQIPFDRSLLHREIPVHHITRETASVVVPTQLKV